MRLFDRIGECAGLGDEERLLVESVRAVSADVIGPNAAHADSSGEFPWVAVKAINDLGLNAVFVPEEQGGAGMSYRAYLACVSEIAKACASTGIIWSTTFHAVKPLIDRGNEEQKRRLLPRILGGGLGALAITEAEAGSDATGMKTRFTPEGDEIVVSGEKIFITNGDVADLFLLFGKWSEIEGEKAAISALLVEPGGAGLEVLRTEDKMGHRASSTAALSFQDYRVPRANLLGEPGEGLDILFAALNKSRPSVAAHALGIARAAFEDGVAHVNQRVQSGRRIGEFQGIQFMLADLASELALCERWLWHVGALIDGGVAEIGIEASMLKLRASDLAMRMTADVVQLHGGYGYCKDLRVERLMRDAKITQIWEGTNQIHRQLIGRGLLDR